jgi:hypothetical protein
MQSLHAHVALLVFACTLREADAHGFMTSPVARNVIHGISNGIGNANAASGGGPASVHDRGRYIHGICGDAPEDSQIYNKVGEVQATYVAGQTAEFKVKITAHHMGFFEFELCDDAGQLSQQCFTRHPLLKEGCDCLCSDGSKNCAACDSCRQWWKPLMKSESKLWAARGYQGPVLEGGYLTEMEFTMKYTIPVGVRTTNGVIRWHYMTTDSCTCTSSTPQEFWNCADVAITEGGSVGAAVSFDNDVLASAPPRDIRPWINNGQFIGVYSTCPVDAQGNLMGVGSPNDYLDACGDSSQYCIRTQPYDYVYYHYYYPQVSEPEPVPVVEKDAKCAGAHLGPCSGCLATDNVCHTAVAKWWCDARASEDFVWCGEAALVETRRAKTRKHTFLGTALLQKSAPMSKVQPEDEL